MQIWILIFVLEHQQYGDLLDLESLTICSLLSDRQWRLDFFFYHYGDNIHVQLCSDDYIREVARLLQKSMNKIQVLTIAISPDCICGNGMKEKWDNGFRVLEIMAEEIYALWEFPFPPQ